MKTDAQFIAALSASDQCVSAVAAWLARHKRDVLVRPLIIRPSFDSRMEYLDEGDIEIRMRVEVKHRDMDFTCAADFPYRTVIVGEKHKVERIPLGRWWGYVHVNRAMTHACIIFPHTAKYWITTTKYDRKDRGTLTFLECPTERTWFVKIGEES